MVEGDDKVTRSIGLNGRRHRLHTSGRQVIIFDNDLHVLRFNRGRITEIIVCVSTFVVETDCAGVVILYKVVVHGLHFNRLSQIPVGGVKGELEGIPSRFIVELQV